MNFYGIEIDNSSSFWDEVKLRAMNNYGDREPMNIKLAITSICADIDQALADSDEVKQLEKEIESGQV